MQASEKPRALVPRPHYTSITLSDPGGGAAFRVFEFKIQPQTNYKAEVTVSCPGYTYTTQISRVNGTVRLPVSEERVQLKGFLTFGRQNFDDDVLIIIQFSGTLKTNTWMTTGSGPNLSNTPTNNFILGIFNAKTLEFITF